MMHPQILALEAGVYSELSDGLGISFTTSELFRGSVAECLHVLGGYPPAARAAAYIETVDGTIRLDPADIGILLASGPGLAA